MYLGRVIGRVVATRRIVGLSGEKLLIVRPLDETGEGVMDSVVACDVVDSGLGDVVHVCDGRESTYALRERFVPVDATIVGHVEEFAHEGSPGITAAAAARPKRKGNGK
jgi:ethanolamine utilization protein EutN